MEDFLEEETFPLSCGARVRQGNDKLVKERLSLDVLIHLRTGRALRSHLSLLPQW